MKTYLDCYPCFLRQTLEAARMNGASEPEQRRILHRVMQVLESADLTSTPPEIAERTHAIIRATMMVDDPYYKVKAENTRQALDLYGHLMAFVATADDGLERAVRLAIAGNAIDLGPPGAPVTSYSLLGIINRAIQQPLAINDLHLLRQRLAHAGHVLCLADNAGETVFDRVWIKTMGLPATYVVKGVPVLNDAILEDAMAAGVDRVARIIDNGSNAPGTILERCSVSFQKEFAEAGLIVAKGQAHYETLSNCGKEVFFLLQVKCVPIAHDVGAAVGSMVIKLGGTDHARI